jgi:predicted CXXCH cytochrome family protein
MADATALCAAEPTTLMPASPSYVGRQACVGCHPAQSAAWTGSNHDRALQVADSSTVRGDFNAARFTYNGITSTFSRKGNDYFVRTDGPDGRLRDYRVAYTIGVYPLQQYLIALDDGRLQALSICWDTRPKREGGQRWFHVYPDEKVDFRDVLHWTGPAQNWNFMCAECHSTDVRKGYDPATNRFDTRWSEIDVSCEACHGPGSAHVGASRADPRTNDAGFSVRFPPGSATDWVFDARNPIARLARARDVTQQVEVCGRCHAHRSQISEAYRHHQPLSQTHMVSLLEEGLYQADGQILGEVYEYGSLLQSRMFARGVGCTDCHDPHSARLRVAGNGVCATCHQSATYDSAQHHHHGNGSTAAQRCVACHMPARTYMVVHERHDHGFRVPRPDLSVSLGTPNACTDCHRDRDAAWAAAAVSRWYGPTRSRGPAYAPALAAGRVRAAGADRQLATIIADPTMPGIVRASAVNLLEGVLSPRLAPTVETALRDLDPLVRRAAVELLPAWDPRQRWPLGAPLLQDPIRTVRLAAVNALADASTAVPLSAGERGAFDQAVAEYRGVQAFNADRAEAWLNLGALQARLGDFAAAEISYQKAIRLQPMFVAAYVNLADVYRQQERDADGERVLREALGRVPDNADTLHTLGLLQVRQRQLAEAVATLGRAAQRDAGNPHYAYVYAVALDSVGQPAKALSVLETAQRRFTGDRELLGALRDIARRVGDETAAARWSGMLRQLD